MFPVSVTRMAMKDLKFSDGTFIPAGNILATPVLPTHMDNENYGDAEVFNPWRFLRLQEESVDNSAFKYQFVTTATDYVAFGHGRHAW